MIIETAAMIAIAALTGVALIGNILVFRAMFAHADRASGRLPDDLSQVTA